MNIIENKKNQKINFTFRRCVREHTQWFLLLPLQMPHSHASWTDGECVDGGVDGRVYGKVDKWRVGGLMDEKMMGGWIDG